MTSAISIQEKEGYKNVSKLQNSLKEFFLREYNLVSTKTEPLLSEQETRKVSKGIKI